MFPVYIYEEGLELPKEGTYFLVAGNGLWMHKDTGIVKAFVPVENISILQDVDFEASVECNLPKLPAQHVWRIKTFFKKIVEKYHSEASTTLYFNKTTGEFKVHAPRQSVSHGGVSYEQKGLTHLEEMKDFLCVGTIHSHCDFAAFHSGTDIGDEADFDGLHVTFGHNDLDIFSISACVAVNGFRLKVDPLAVLDGIEPVPGQEGRYKLATLAPELEQQWSEGLDGWMRNVSTIPNWWMNQPEGICRGDNVVWAGELGTVPFKSSCGEGPFVVAENNNGQLTIVTKFGLARFSEKLFKKV